MFVILHYHLVLKHTVGAERLIKSRPKKLVKLKKSITRKFFWSNFIFCNFKNDQKSIFELGKSLKLPKMQFLIYLISRVFFRFSGQLCIVFHGLIIKKNVNNFSRMGLYPLLRAPINHFRMIQMPNLQN